MTQENSPNDLQQSLQARLRLLDAAGLDRYPDRYVVTHTNIVDCDSREGVQVALAGRVRSLRSFGRMLFLELFDITGTIQVQVRFDVIGAELYRNIKQTVRIGDFIGARGRTFHTRTGEYTIQADSVVPLALSMRQMPDKWHGIQGVETRYRQRYLDTVARATTRKVLIARSRVIAAMRRFFERSGFFEIDTPILNHTRAGALAKPFTTHHNALDIDLFLRIAPETYLKQACAAGFSRVFEMARCFRNEGISPDHLQEFTMLEFYGSYWSFEENMQFSRALLQDALETAFGSLHFTTDAGEANDERIVDFSGDWPTVTFRDAIYEHSGIDIDVINDSESLLDACACKAIELDTEDRVGANFGRILDALYKKVARPALEGPLFLVGHPIETSPLARRNDEQPQIADRFQLVIRGVELMNGYSELVDPVDQRQRLEAQANYLAGGDDQAMDIDEDFLLCMEHGMPPISGCGVGIDRLLKIVMGLPNIRDAVLFPLLRPRGDQHKDGGGPDDY